MKTKILLTIVVPFILLNCMAQNRVESPYVAAMKHLMSDDSIFIKIIADNEHETFDNTKVKLFGYINKDDLRIYSSRDFRDPLESDDEYYKSYWSILLYEDYHNKKLLDVSLCKGNDNLVEVHGTFHVEKLANGDAASFYLTNIKKVYEFDITLLNKGGKGEKLECYPE